MLHQVFQPVGMRMKNHDRNFESFQILLVSEICIQRNEDIKISFCQCKQIAVLFP